MRPRWWLSQRGRFGFFIITLVLCACLALVYQIWLSRTGGSPTLPNGAQLATALVAAAAAFFAYYQWTDTRRESSLDKFYERLSLVNERYYNWKGARQLVNHFWSAAGDETDFEEAMYVYLELDNLDYILFRYELGFVTAPLLHRAITTFRSRCQSSEFSNLAVRLVEGAWYDSKTVGVVKALVGSIPHGEGAANAQLKT